MEIFFDHDYVTIERREVANLANKVLDSFDCVWAIPRPDQMRHYHHLLCGALVSKEVYDEDFKPEFIPRSGVYTAEDYIIEFAKFTRETVLSQPCNSEWLEKVLRCLGRFYDYSMLVRNACSLRCEEEFTDSD